MDRDPGEAAERIIFFFDKRTIKAAKDTGEDSLCLSSLNPKSSASVSKSRDCLVSAMITGRPVTAKMIDSIGQQVIKIAHGIRTGHDSDNAAILHHGQPADIMLDHQPYRIHRAFSGLDGDKFSAHEGLHGG